MDLNEADDIMLEYAKEQKKELDQLFVRINSGEKSLDLYYNLFMTYKYMQKKDEYKEEIDKYAKLTQEYARDNISKNDDVSHAYIILSNVFEHYKDRQQVLFYANKAVEADPQNADAYMARADAYKDLGKKKMAKADYDMAISLDPDYATILKHTEETDRLIKESNRFIVYFYFMIGFMVLIFVYSMYLSIKDFFN